MLEISRKYTLIQEIRIAIPKAMTSAIAKIGIAHNICHEYGSPINTWMTPKTMRVGINLKRAMTVAEIGNITLGKDVFIIKRWPEVIALTPPVRLFATK
jgi:hypothetical protein